MKPGALVLGSNAGQADLIRHLAAAGWDVTACGNVRGSVGEREAHAFAPVDIRDVEAVAELARSRGVELVYSVSSDVAVPTVVEVSARLGLPYFFDPDIVMLFHHKPRLRRWLNQRDLGPVPFAEVHGPGDVADWATFPAIVKPADSQGSRGIAKVTDAAGLSRAIEAAVAASPTGTAIVEGFLAGVEVSFNVLVAKGDIIVIEPSERLVHPEPLVGIPSGHLIPPVRVAPEAIARADRLVRDVVSALGITDGTLYFQMKMTEDGPKIVEIAPRLDGCHIWRLMKHARGFDFIDLSVAALVGEPVAAPQAKPLDGVYELQFQQMPPGGTFRSADFPAPADALYHEYRYADGEVVKPINGQMEVVGYYVRRQQPA